MKYSFVVFNNGKVHDYITLLIGSYTLEEIKALARIFYLENKKNPMVTEIMLKAGIDLMRPTWYENYKINR